MKKLLFPISIIIFTILVIFVTFVYANNLETEAVKGLTDYGILGIVVIAMGWFIMYLVKKHDASTNSLGSRIDKINDEHRTERTSWQEHWERKQEKSDIIICKNTQAMSDHSVVIAELRIAIADMIMLFRDYKN